MKKIVLFFILIIFLSTSTVCESYDYFQWSFSEGYIYQSIANLEKHGVIESTAKWDKTSLISRRDVFKMVLDIKATNGAFNYDPQKKYTAEDIKRSRAILEMNDYVETQVEYYQKHPDLQQTLNPTELLLKCQKEVSRLYVGHDSWYVFADIDESSDDLAFTMFLYFSSLLRGKNHEGLMYAALDEVATYEDAINTICRLFTNIKSRNPEYAIEGLMKEKYPNSEHILFNYAEEINLINTKNYADPCCPQISYEMLSKPITAYEFFVLLNRALYIPAPCCDDYTPTEMFYYIDNYR